MPTEQPRARELHSSLQASLGANIATIKGIFSVPRNKDLVIREFATCAFAAAIVYIDGMAGSSKIAEGIMEPCLAKRPGEPIAPDDRAQYLASQVINLPQIDKEDILSNIVEAILDGKTALMADGCAEALLMETRDYEKRNVSRAQNESGVVGPQQGFVENLRTNVTLVRRIVRSPALVTEMVRLGSDIATSVAIMYIDGVVSERALAEIERRIRSLNVGYLSSIGQLEALIEDSTWFMLPQVLTTERPDRVAPALLDGQIAILMDNSPYALIAPISFFHLFHATDDDALRWQYGAFTRFLRLLGMFISLYLPGIYMAISLYHTHMIPTPLLTSIAQARAQVPFPIFVEVLFMEFSFFLTNEAGTRLPSQIGSALGIVGALILGQSAVAANIISPMLIIIVALAGLGNYAAPIYPLTIAFGILRFCVLFVGAAFGLYGIMLVTFLMLCCLCAARSFGEPMMTPYAPYKAHNPDLLMKFPFTFNNRRMFFAKRHTWLRQQPPTGKMRRWEDEQSGDQDAGGAP